jgi:hypothetical protein
MEKQTLRFTYQQQLHGHETVAAVEGSSRNNNNSNSNDERSKESHRTTAKGKESPLSPFASHRNDNSSTIKKYENTKRIRRKENRRKNHHDF